ncbi:hypothetical protein FRC04_003648 [Tulasnella sp. 424]|nr:hypothetical protein FRC04_003648 [Tulasnella sp. 424]
MPQRPTTQSTFSLYRPSATILHLDRVVAGLSEKFESHLDVSKTKLIKLLFMHGEGRCGGRLWMVRRGRCRRSVSETNLDDDIEVLEKELGSEEEEDGSSLDFSTSGSLSSTLVPLVVSISAVLARPFVIPDIPNFTFVPTHGVLLLHAYRRRNFAHH